MFHVREGFCFDKLGNGDVGLYKDGNLLLTIDKDSWCSVVASMSSRGDNRENFEKAKEFHFGQIS